MIWKETKQGNKPIAIWLHGGGLSDWSLKGMVNQLEEDYCVITPILDGHGEDGEETFISIADSSEKLINYIDSYCGGKVYLLGGLSLGAQIVIEVLSRREDIAEYAVVESALVYSMKNMTACMTPFYTLFYRLINKKWFSRMQAKSLCLPTELFEQYYQDSRKMSKKSLINITKSNGNFELKEGIARTKSKVLILVGGKEIRIMKKSAQKLHHRIDKSRLHMASKMKHGEFSLVYPKDYVKVVKEFIDTSR
ncbi:MAG: alpha/beta hydrolase [Mobilitalea sp.]